MDTAGRVELAQPLQLPEDGFQPQAPEDCEPPAIAILTSGKLLIIPESVYADFPGVKGFKVDREGERIILTPIQPPPIKEVWAQTAAQGVTAADVAEAVRWARGQR